MWLLGFRLALGSCDIVDGIVFLFGSIPMLPTVDGTPIWFNFSHRFFIQDPGLRRDVCWLQIYLQWLQAWTGHDGVQFS